MLKSLFIIIFSLPIFSGVAFARIHLPGEPGAEQAKHTEDPVDDTTLAVAARAGYFGAVLFGEGAAVAWRIPKWEFGVAAYHGASNLTATLGDQVTTDAELAAYTVDKLTLSATQVVVEARYFLLPNFTINAGLGWRSLKGEVTLSAIDGSAGLISDAAVTNIIATASLSSLWSWPNGFFFGIDWIGIEEPLTKSWNVDTQGSGAALADLESQTETMAKTIASAPSLILALGSLGWRF